MRPKISVIIPCYNQGHFLSTAIESVLHQSYSNVEILLVNDGSTDATDIIARDYGNLVKYLRTKHQGLPAARNTALSRSSGDFCNFLDADDYLLPCALEAFAQATDQNPDASVFYGGWQQINSSGEVAVQRPPYQFTGDVFHSLLCEDPFPCNSLLVRRTVIDQVGGFDCSMESSEDWDLWLRIAARSHKFVPVPGAIVAYRRYAGSMSSDAKRMFRSRLSVQRRARLLHKCRSCRSARIAVDFESGRNELILCREQPDYRRHSSISGISIGSPWERMLRHLVVRTQFPSEALTRALYSLVTENHAMGISKLIGQKLYRARTGIERYRRAIREVGSWETYFAEFGLQLPVLLYHNVSPNEAERCPELTLSPQEFERHIRWLANHGYVGIRASDWLSWVRHAKPLPPKPVLITFDDGYADVASHALPVISKYNFAATVFVIPGKLGEPNPWDRQILMNREQLMEWSSRGIEFGSHSFSHPDLTTVTNEDIIQEIKSSAHTIEEITGAPVTSFAYPYGRSGPALTNHLKTTYKQAFTITEGLNHLRTDPYQLCRTFVPPKETLIEFIFRVRLGWNPLQKLRATLNIRSRLRGLKARIG